VPNTSKLPITSVASGRTV